MSMIGAVARGRGGVIVREPSAELRCGRMHGVSRTGGAVGRGAEGKYLVRPARDGDLAVIASLEVEIARVSFGDEAITDAAFHRRRVASSLGKPGEITLVAVGADDQDVPLGWAW